MEWFENTIVSSPTDLLATVSRAVSAVLHLFDNTFLDGFVGSIASGMGSAGRVAKKRQSGVLTDYLWNAFAMVLILIAILLFLE